MTLVNVMPILLNRYLGSSLPLHPDDLFFGPEANQAPISSLKLLVSKPYSRDILFGEPYYVVVHPEEDA